MIGKEALDTIYTLWDKLADYDVAAHKPALDHLMEGLCSLVNAQNVLWLVPVRMSLVHLRDPLRGWRPYAFRHLRSNPGFEQRFGEIARELDRHYTAP